MTTTLTRLARRLRKPQEILTVQRTVSPLFRGRRWGINSKRLQNKRYLDVGCGPRINPNFISLDYYWRPGIDVCWDATKKIPLASSSLQGVFSEHCIEHLPLEGASSLFGEAHRMLMPGGTIRIIVPDGELYLRRYVEHLNNERAEPFPHDEIDTFDGVQTPMISVNRIFRMWGHQFIYDFHTLSKLLERHGFIDIKPVDFRTGRDPVMLLDDEFHRAESMYVEATKPG